MKRDFKQITTKSGVQDAIAPAIISASRATDIPAFFSSWMIERLHDGYCAWINPFNQKKQYVSFKNCKCIVFWSKNPEPLIHLLPKIDSMGISYYFQFTINDYAAELLEPGLPELEKRLETFITLSEKIGKERVIWRYDPIFLSGSLSIDHILEKIRKIASILCEYTDKLVFSFADFERYKNVKKNIQSFDKTMAEPSLQEMSIFARRLSEDNARLQKPLILATCAEKIELSQYGIHHNRCIDGELINSITKKSSQLSLFRDDEQFSDTVYLKDTGQRRECLCVISKDIGAYNTCKHGCIYCYANFSQKHVESNLRKMTQENESLLF